MSQQAYSPDMQRRLLDLSRRLLAHANATNALEATTLATDLQTVIRYHEWRYYVLHEPVLGDTDFDQLFKKLEHLEAMFPELQTVDSPTQRVSSDLIDNFAAVQHLTPMLSLQNSYNAEDLTEFDEQVKKNADLPSEMVDIGYVVEPKFDGGTIVLLYENDLLVRAATRGNGAIGDEITLNAKVIPSIPLRADFSKFGIRRVELRGEALIAKKNFEIVNAMRQQRGDTLFANPRNAATGGLRMKNPRELAERRVEAFVYQLGYFELENGSDTGGGANLLDKFETHQQTIETLRDLGFKVPTDVSKRCKNIAEVAKFCSEWGEKRDNYDYEIDGMVVKVDDLGIQSRCGSTSHHPRWAIAYKFQARQATTKLISVEFQVGKIGTITPVAKVEPVQVAGVTVSSISLHNEENIRSRDLRLGDTVIVERAGDVIPQIVKSIPDLRNGSETVVEYPTFCPMNAIEKVPLVKEEGEAAWRCVTCTCGAQDLQRMIFHVSKHAMNIESFGESNLERFQKLGWVKSIVDIYKIDYQRVANLDGFGAKSATNLRNSIDKAKQNPIHRLLHSLSIHQMGREAAKLVASEIENVFDLTHWTVERYTQIKGIGPVLAQNMVAFFDNEKNMLMLESLRELGVNMTATDEDKPKNAANIEGRLTGKTILFTGTLTTFTREKAEAAAISEGATLISGVSKNLNILVVGEKAGSKLEKAQKIATIEIMTEQQFLEFLNS
ncbi:MAG: ligase, NAD-dependent [Bacteroidota bacterium]|jgi:DNA ligase (NAD+)